MNDLDNNNIYFFKTSNKFFSKIRIKTRISDIYKYLMLSNVS